MAHIGDQEKYFIGRTDIINFRYSKYDAADRKNIRYKDTRKVFKIWIPNRTLQEAEWDETQCVFITGEGPLEDTTLKAIKSVEADTIEYRVIYDGGTKLVTMYASSYIRPEQQLTEPELDEMAMETCRVFDGEMILMSKDIEVGVSVYGIVDQVQLVYPKARNDAVAGLFKPKLGEIKSCVLK